MPDTQEPNYLRAAAQVDSSVANSPINIQTSPKAMLDLMKRSLAGLHDIDNKLVGEIQGLDKRLDDVRINIRATNAAIEAIEGSLAKTQVDKPSMATDYHLSNARYAS